MGLDDIIVIFSIVIENIQYLQIGPNFSRYNAFVSKFTTYASLFLLNMHDWKKEGFWRYEIICFAFSGVWVTIILA